MTQILELAHHALVEKDFLPMMAYLPLLADLQLPVPWLQPALSQT
jgi:hypothetical protein